MWWIFFRFRCKWSDRMDSRIGKKQHLSSEIFQYFRWRCILKVRRENTVEICSIIKNNVCSDIFIVEWKLSDSTETFVKAIFHQKALIKRVLYILKESGNVMSQSKDQLHNLIEYCPLAISLRITFAVIVVW